MFIFSLLRSFNLSWLRYFSATVLITTSVIGCFRWISLWRKNKRYKVRTESLIKLRELVRNHRGSDDLIVRVQITQLKVFGVNAFVITLPNPITGWLNPNDRCIYTRHDMPDGDYTCHEDGDFLILTRLRNGKLTSVDFPLRVVKPKYKEPRRIIFP